MSLLEHLGGVVAQQMSHSAAAKTGVDEGVAAKMLPVAMAALMGGLKKNASDAQGAEALARALDRHDGGLLNQISRVGDDDVLADGQKIVGHILGGKQGATQLALAKAAGVDEAQVGQLLAMAAPALLGALGRARREQGLDVAALAGLVTEEGVNAQRAAPPELGGLLGFLDQDGDGDFKDDMVAAAGKSLIGGLFGRK